MIFFLFIAITFFSGCQALPQLYQAAEDVLDDKAIEVMVSREAIQKQKNVSISIEVKNDATTK